MMLKAALLIFLFASVITVHSDDINSESDVETDPELEKYLKDAIENFREQMKEGIDAINMPRLDPLNLRNLDVNVDENLATMNLQIKEIIVRDLSTFQLDNISANLETFFLKLKLKIPSVQASGKYSLNGKLLKIFPLNGNGYFSINLTAAEIGGSGKLVPREDTLQMNELDLDLSWEQLDIFLENFLGGGRFSEVLQRMLPNVGKKVFESYKPAILNSINKVLTKSLNDVLKKPEVKEIVKGLVTA